MSAANRRRTRGQALVIMAVMLPALMSAMALAIDAGYLFVQHRLMQSAADLAALAGARALPADAAGAQARARSVAGSNGYMAGVSVTTPYVGAAGQIEVRITAGVRPFFLPVLGVQTVDVGARAVAQSVAPQSLTHAIFAGEVNCGSGSEKHVDWSGSDIDVVGAVHSNGGITVGGSNNSVVGATTYHCLNRFSNGGSGNSLVPAQQRAVNPNSWPISYTAADFPCTYTRAGTFDLSDNGAWWVGGSKNSKLLRPGVYCATGANGILKLSDSGITGNVTFVAGYQVEISGSNFTLTSYRHSVLAFALGNFDNALKLNGSGGSWQGVLYAPNGWAELSGGSNLSISGAIVAEQVKLSGSSMTINVTGLQSTAPPVLRLIQ